MRKLWAIQAFHARMKIRIAFVTFAVAALAIAVPALAEPKHKGVVSASTPTFTWKGGPGTGLGIGSPPAATGISFRCREDYYECEDILVEVKDAGTLAWTIKAGEGSSDLDVRIYKSDASGAKTGEPIAQDIEVGADAKASTKVTPGFYVAEVAFFEASEGVYDGTAALSGFAAPADPGPTPPTSTPPPPSPTPTPSSTPAPSSQQQPNPGSSSAKTRAAYKKCMKKAKKVKNKKKRSKALKKCKKIK